MQPDHPDRTYPLSHPKLFFFHLPKAAGISISQAIRQASDPRGHAPSIAHKVNHHDALAGDYNRFKGYNIYGLLWPRCL